jgi:Zn-dependent protease
MINLFNLIPLSPLDGGRITAIISPKVWWIGAPLLIGLFFWDPSPMLLLIALLALPQLAATFRGGDHAQLEGYYDVPIEARVSYALWYLGLAAILGIMSFELYNLLQRG